MQLDSLFDTFMKLQNGIILLGGVGGLVLLCQTQTSNEPNPNNGISSWNILVTILLLNVPS